MEGMITVRGLLWPYIPVLVLAAAGGLGGWLRYDFDANAHGHMRPTRLAFTLLGATAACLVYALAAKSFPDASSPTQFGAGLIGIGSFSGFWGIELLLRLMDRLTGSPGLAYTLLARRRRRINRQARKLTRSEDARLLCEWFPFLRDLYDELEHDNEL